MPVRALVVSAWKEPNPNGLTKFDLERRMQVVSDYPPLLCEDISAVDALLMPTDAHVTLVLGVWTNAAYAAMAADPNYGDPAILWSDAKDVAGTVSNADLLALGNFLINKRGISSAIVTAARNALQAGDTRLQLGQKLINWLRNRPKAG